MVARILPATVDSKMAGAVEDVTARSGHHRALYALAG